jgi:hypothetical protein
MFDFGYLENIDSQIILNFLLNPEFSGWLLWFKVVFLLLNLIMIGFIIFSLLKTSWLDKLVIHDIQEFLTYKHFGLSKTKKKWKEIQQNFEGGTEPEMKLAIVEANSLLDNVLRIMTYKGKNLGERLEKINDDILENLEEVKEAYTVYSNIVNDPTYHLTVKKTEEVLKSYREALVNLDAL